MMYQLYFFFFKQKTAYERRISDWSTDVCSSELVPLGTGQEEARRLLHQRRIEKLLVVDDAYRCIGLITVKDIEKAVTYPNATKDAAGRLRVAAATTVGDRGFARTEALVD